jgi:predicted dehydrogenase
MQRIGILGYGSRISGVVHNVVRQAKGQVSVEAFYDRSGKARDRATADYPDIRVCNSTEELVGIDELDWIFIGSFNAAHHEHAIPAIHAGKHVFCEKPLATTLDQQFNESAKLEKEIRKSLKVLGYGGVAR